MLGRARRRYILVKIDSEAMPSERDFQRLLWSSIIRLFGEYGASQADASLIEYNREAKYAILRCQHDSLFMVRAALATITKADGDRISAHVLLVSGTLKALKRRMQNIFICGGVEDSGIRTGSQS